VVQDAVVAALEHWPSGGVPDNPGAWLLTTARRRAIDKLRRDARFRELAPKLAANEELDMAPSGVDDRLRMLFTCCHPALRQDAQVALTLRTVAGLSTAEVARAFIVPEATIAQRIVRAQKKIRGARIPYRVPSDEELPDRVASVLAVLYLVFNEGYLASTEPTRPDLAGEAEWLASLVVELMPDEPEAIGLLALMRLHLARADARFSPDGALVLLEDQDRTKWDHQSIAAATKLLDRALRLGRPGPYQVQAAIAALHAQAPSFDETDWRQITLLYDELLRMSPTPVVALNRAVAVALVYGPHAGLECLEPLAADLDRYHPFHATRAEFFRRADQPRHAIEALDRAIALCANPSERRHLERRRLEIRPAPP
jgi:RNA polymerase sigma-70 factor (ECF subfamily)